MLRGGLPDYFLISSLFLNLAKRTSLGFMIEMPFFTVILLIWWLEGGKLRCTILVLGKVLWSSGTLCIKGELCWLL